MISWGDPAGSLRLGIEAADGLVLWLENVGDTALTVLSHVRTAGGPHLDWYGVVLTSPAGDTIRLVLVDDRDRSATARADLAPGETLSHRVDVTAWASRPVNGGRPLPAGRYQARAYYEVDPEPDVWSGRVDSGSVFIIL